MADQMTTLAVFIDYDNLLPAQKTTGILDVVTKALVQVPRDPGLMRARCEVRVYGGWYEGTAITVLAQDVAVELQRDFPTIIRLPKLLSGEVTVSLAAMPIEEDGDGGARRQLQISARHHFDLGWKDKGE